MIKFLSAVFLFFCCTVHGQVKYKLQQATEKSATQRTNDGADELFKINLYFFIANNTILADGVLEKYNNSYTKNVTTEDVGKLDNIDENVAILRGSKKLTIEKRPLIDDDDTIFLNTYNFIHSSYQFRIFPVHFTATDLSAYIEDRYLNTKTPVSLRDSSIFNFSVTRSILASKDTNRFRIIYRPEKHFRSAGSGNWKTNNIWQMSNDSTTWQAADIYPAGAVKSAVIQSGHTITLADKLSVEKAIINTGGTVHLSTGSVMTILK